MPLTNFVKDLAAAVTELETAGTAKGAEQVVVDVLKPTADRGARVLLQGHGDKQFIRMNSNSYLGLAMRDNIVAAEEAAAQKFGVGPGAVRFISGTYEPHVQLEKKLAAFHGREACMLTSAAYTSVLGVISTLATPETIILSDELNHNCIINAMKLARPKAKRIYKHLNMAEMEKQIQECVGQCECLLVITDGVFSMRGVYAPLKEMCAIVEKYNHNFPRDIVLIVDDSHGVGSMGDTGRGTEELCGAKGVDILVATLGKALGVNGGYICSRKEVIHFLREKNPFYIYTNPITPSEATAAMAGLDMLDSPEGKKIVAHLHAMTKKFEQGLVDLGYETIPSPHPVTPLMLRDTERTTRCVSFLRENGVLATGLNFPVVPKGDQSIRFQVCADHQAGDIDYVLGVLEKFKNV
ncbi:MAG: aminotransferase class I/II-fold pyridoxal phosphate-dependent enzyme [candidate division Zixibacteria bacterium]|nr:aminotransferase class I/II-fold pyridoxal phosphate-dependent enzyme [candidate division Zixibacteria bacterium]